MKTSINNTAIFLLYIQSSKLGLTIFRTTALVFLLGLTIFTYGHAAEWPGEAKTQMDAAGKRLSTATTTAERVTALRDIEQIAAAYPQNEEARLTANLIAQKAVQEAGPAKILEALGELAASGQITDAQTIGTITTPLLSTISQMRENGTLLPETAIQLDAAIKKVNDVAAKLNLPSLTESIDKATGDTELAGKLADTLNKIATLADLAKKSADLQKMNEDARRDYINSIPFYDALPPGARVVFRDTLVWNGEMFNESANTLDLIADAMETGQFNHEAYNKIQNRLKELSKGPWNSKTASDFFKDLCKKIPIAGAWCDDIFQLGEKLLSDVDCDSIDCDCRNVGGGIMRGPLIVECKLHEDDLKSKCKEKKKIIGSCGGSSGPAANPK